MSSSSTGFGQERVPFRPTSASYGSGASPVLRKTAAGRLSDATALAVVPWVVFTLAAGLFALALEDYAPLVWAMAAACALVAVLFVAMGAASGAGSHHVALGVLTLGSVGVGALVGLVLDQGYMGAYWNLENGAVYRDLDPAEAAASRTDGTHFYFAKGSSVDTQRSLGYMSKGDVYCVAPIVGPHSSSTIQYWAVGRNCCDRVGGFACGGDSGAELSGVVAAEGGADYRTAARMAQSVYHLEPPRGVGAPIFVEETKDIAAHQRSLWRRGVTLLLVASGLDLVVSCCFGVLLSRLPK